MVKAIKITVIVVPDEKYFNMLDENKNETLSSISIEDVEITDKQFEEIMKTYC